jgi:hypothetical protein
MRMEMAAKKMSASRGPSICCHVSCSNASTSANSACTASTSHSAVASLNSFTDAFQLAAFCSCRPPGCCVCSW